MKSVKRTVRMLAITVMVCVLLATTAFAAGGSVWLGVTAEEDGTTVLVSTDTVVTDGVIAISYDSGELTYVNLEVDEEYVAMYSVNTDTEGVVRISWVAPGVWEADENGTALIRVYFSGTTDEQITLTGTLCGADGGEIALTAGTDTEELQKAILEAEALDADHYTQESYAVLEQALAEARAVLADPAASQKAVDAAAAELTEAMAALELRTETDQPGSDPSQDPDVEPDSQPSEQPGNGVDTTELQKAILKASGLDKENYTKKSFAAVEKALAAAEAVLADANATQEAVDAATEELNAAISALVLAGSETPGTGDSAMLGAALLLAVLSAVGIAAAVILKNKMGRAA